MPRVILKHVRPARPHLVHLRRVFDKIPRHACTAEARIFDVRKHAVQRVTELVKRGAHFILREQRRLAGRWLRNVQMVGDHRFRAEQIALLHISVHPRAALL